MKKLNVIRTAFSFLLLLSVFVIDGCKKETVVSPAPTVTKTVANGIAVNPSELDSVNYLKGYLGGDLVKFEGRGIYYNGYVDPDSGTNPGGQQHEDNDAYFMNGTKWVTIMQSGLQAVNATVELRSLAVRVFVSPLQAQSSTYYNLIQPISYQVATLENPSKGAYVSLYDASGTLWTSAGDQDGSTVTVSTIGPNLVSYAVVTGQISCKMYDQHGNMKTLTGATFTAALGI